MGLPCNVSSERARVPVLVPVFVQAEQNEGGGVPVLVRQASDSTSSACTHAYSAGRTRLRTTRMYSVV